MGVPFDHIASAYNEPLTYGAIGQMQRKRVWDYLERITPELSGLEILELSNGTGEDALLFSEKGCNLVATDVSEEMLKVTQQKVQQYSLQHNISSHYLDLDAFDETIFNKKFDLIFSNFGTLNLIHPLALKRLMQKLPSLLAPEGRFVAVVMPRYCLWETMYFLSRFRFKLAFRRWTSKEVLKNIAGAATRTWYYQPGEFRRWTRHLFGVVRQQPIGITIPAQNLEHRLVQRKKWLRGFYRVEKRLSNYGFLSRYSDHYLIDLKVK